MFKFSDEFFKKVEKKTSVDKDTILSLASKLQKANMKDETVIRDLIHDISNMTGKPVDKDREDKIINAVIKDDITKNINKMVD